MKTKKPKSDAAVNRIDKLTPEQGARIAEWRDKWIAIGLRTGETQWADFERGVRACYDAAHLAQPKIVVRVASPMALALAPPILALERIGKRDAVDGAVRDAVRDAVRGAVRGAVGGAVDGAVDGAVRDAVGGAASTLTDAWYNRLGGQFWVGGWWGGPAYVSFFRQVCGLSLEPEIEQAADAYRLACKSGCWWLPYSGFVVLCARPAELHRDAEGRLHCETGPAIAWPDGWGVYSWHGTRVPAEWITDRASLSPVTALTHANIEQRRAAAEIVGWARILEHVKAEVVDADGDPEIGTLYRADLPDAPGSQFLKVKCGTGREFVLPVPGEMKTALESNSWTFDVPQVDLKKLEART